MRDVTIKDIASETGYSIATVSRVINNNPSVSEETRSIVNSAISRLGYYPNLVARNLKSNSTKIIALLIADGTNEYFIQMAKAIDSVVHELGYTLFICSSFNDSDKEQSYLHMLAESKIDGIILNTCCKNDDYIAQLSKRIPIVLLHRRLRNSKFEGDFIDADFGRSAYELTMEMINNGHKKIGLISGQLYLSSAYDRYKNFKKALETINIRVDKNYKYFYEGPFTSDFGYEATEKLLNCDDPPTAMMIMHCETTIGALRYCHANNIKVPEDISFVSPCNITLSDLFYVHPYYAIPDTTALGERAGEMIIERILNKSMPNREVNYMPTIVPGNSICNINNTEHKEEMCHHGF